MKWISVKDRLPDADEVEVIVCTSGDEYSTIESYDCKEHVFWTFWGNCCVRICGVTHWMYLPKPPSKNELFEDLKEALEECEEKKNDHTN